MRHPILGTPGLLTEGVGYVRHPGSMCFDGVYLQVTDTGKNRVQKLVTDEFAHGVLNITGLNGPLDFDTDSDGNIYIADPEHSRILIYEFRP